MKKIFLFISLVLIGSYLYAQQVPDTSFTYENKYPAFPPGKGPIVLVDEAHHNFHKIGERYRPFAKLLRNDGYVLNPGISEITEKLLGTCKIFVTSVPTSKNKQSAYSKEEIQILKNWVKEGGSLLLITDHMPDPPAIVELAAAFGIEVINGYVLNEAPNEDPGPIYFKRIDGTLADYPITNGRNKAEKINTITSFTGCALKAGEDFIPLMTFGPYKTSWMTKEEGKFPPGTPKIDVEGWYQGGVMEYGKGRLAFFGEAGMFTAQVIRTQGIKFGMNVSIAKENPQFLLNIFHWLSRIL